MVTIDMMGVLAMSTIVEDDLPSEGSLVNNRDIISGGQGNDFIISSFDADTIAGGLGNDTIFSNTLYRDFSLEYVLTVVLETIQYLSILAMETLRITVKTLGILMANIRYIYAGGEFSSVLRTTELLADQ